MLLDRLNRVAIPALLREHSEAKVIYLGGGSGRVLFAACDAAEAFARHVRELYQQNTANARISVEVTLRQPGEAFPGWMARGVRESQHNKLARVEALPLLGGRWLRPCSSCGKEPAQQVPQPDVQGMHYLCASCLYKREEVSTGSSTVNRGHKHHRSIRRLSALEGHPRC